MSDTPLTYYDCKKCNKQKKVKRIIRGGSGMIFKGSGFYLTDYTDYGKSPENSKSDKKKKDSKIKNKKNGKDKN